ncbi:allantoin transport [Diplodia corticola]|uniref:Allantoin transport n=1 Tax=Diplodia corticola TaxID=236234 RepID=A0A1J9S882_9PEZI|nr:allantoin transport [Diplodia corticola]OJD35789.1 allantoin transport [Diplodia corticola]
MAIKHYSPRKVASAVRVRWSAFRAATRSTEEFKKYMQTRDSDEAGAWSWKNEDLLPTPRSKRTWRARHYIFFYSSLAMDNWTLGSAMVGVGLNWWQAIVAVFIGEVLRSVAAALNSRCAEVYHIGFPVVARSVFGMYGAYYAVAARAVLAAIYYSLKMYVGSAFIVNMLHAAFGSSFTGIPNHLPESLGLTTQQMLAFFLFWLLHIPFAFLRPNQLTWLFTLKMPAMLLATLGLFTFCIVATRATLTTSVPHPTTTTPWLYLYAINSVLGAHSTLTTNQPDYSRWAATPTASTWPLLAAWPLSATLATALGILATAAINRAWGLTLWNPWDLLTAVLQRHWTAGARVGVLACAALWALCALGTNVAANMVPLGADAAMVLAPRYVDARRGQALGLLLAWAVCPWYVYASAAVFTRFLSGYGLFMGGLTGVMVVEYHGWVRGNVFVADLFDGGRSNPHYYYARGWNWQAYAAYLCGMALGFPGFCGSLGAEVSAEARKLGYLGWLLAFTVSMVVYSGLCWVWPTQVQLDVKRRGLRREEMALCDADNDRDADQALEEQLSVPIAIPVASS